MRLLDYLLRRRHARHRRRYYFGHPPSHRRRGHTRVHVSGCCLPIPCGTLVLMAGTGAEIARRRMR